MAEVATAPYTARELYVEERDRIRAIPGISETLKQAQPEDSAICIVEDTDGQIVAAVGALTIVHADEFWIAPSHQGNVAVVRTLLAGLFEMLREHHIAMVSVVAPDDATASMVERLGGCDVGRLFLLPVPPEET